MCLDLLDKLLFGNILYMLEENKGLPDRKFLRNMERFLALGNEQGVDTFVLVGSLQNANDFDQMWWAAYYPQAFGPSFGYLATGIFGKCTPSYPTIRDLIEKAKIPEGVKEEDFTVSTDDNNYGSNQEKLSDDMPTTAIILLRSSRTGRSSTVLRTISSCTPNEALGSLKESLRRGLSFLN